ncbi:FliH/SctL family protein [Modestobacter sp. NPDC049651]|uniref:FliH/SctL family protein n=1 Tax=unclassified Modestobacter TaxID=2643866 RepID=UPI0033D2040F
MRSPDASRPARSGVLLRGESAAAAAPWRRTPRPAPDAQPYSAVVLASPAETVAVPVPRPAPPAGEPQRVEPAPYTGPERRRGGGPRLGEVYAEQLEALREEARRDGWAAGHAEGIVAAEQVVAAAEQAAEQRLAEAQARWERRLASATAAMAAAATRLEEVTAPASDELRDSVLDAVVTLVEELLGRELALAATPGLDALRRALSLSPTDVPVVVRLHPDDLAELPDGALAGLPGSVTVVADPGVERAGAVAEAGARRVDAQLSAALQRAVAVLRS